MQKLRQARNEAKEKALSLLTDEQKSRFEEMKGEKFELQRRAQRGCLLGLHESLHQGLHQILTKLGRRGQLVN